MSEPRTEPAYRLAVLPNTYVVYVIPRAVVGQYQAAGWRFLPRQAPSDLPKIPRPVPLSRALVLRDQAQAEDHPPAPAAACEPTARTAGCGHPIPNRPGRLPKLCSDCRADRLAARRARRGAA